MTRERDPDATVDILPLDDRVEIVVASAPSPLDQRLARLTPSEACVARLLLDGLGNDEIAARRGTSVRTVDGQVQDILRVYDVQDRGGLAWALVGPDEPTRREGRAVAPGPEGREGIVR